MSKSKDGITSISPQKTSVAVKISKTLNFSWKKNGSINVTNTGKVEKVIKPTATVDI